MKKTFVCVEMERNMLLVAVLSGFADDVVCSRLFGSRRGGDAKLQWNESTGARILHDPSPRQDTKSSCKTKRFAPRMQRLQRAHSAITRRSRSSESTLCGYAGDDQKIVSREHTLRLSKSSEAQRARSEYAILQEPLRAHPAERRKRYGSCFLPSLYSHCGPLHARLPCSPMTASLFQDF